MQVCKYFPVANDRMGIIWALSSIKDACIIEFGPAGTTHYAVEVMGNLSGNNGESANIYSTHMDEKDITFGKFDKLEKAIIEVDKNLSPKYIFVMASSVSSIIGTDVENVCEFLQDSLNAKLIPITTGGLKYDFNVGVEYILEVLAKKVVLNYPKNNKKYNIIGYSIDKYNFESDINEIKRMMEKYFDKELNTVFTCNTSISEIEKASESSLNIVVRKEGLKCAKYLYEKYNIPYVYQNLYGIENTEKFISEVSKIEGFDLNKENFEKDMKLIKSNVFGLKMKLRNFNENKKCALIGDYETVLGLADTLKSFGLEIDRKEVLYHTNDKEVISSCNELDRMLYLKNNELFLLFGDAPSLDMAHNAKFAMQISNPNLGKVNIFPYKPLVGLYGVLYLIEKIMNVRTY